MLRELTTADLPIVYEQQLDPEAHRMAAFGPAGPRDWAAFDAHWAKVLADESCVKQVIVEDGRIVGNIGAFWMDGEHEVTYWIAREHWGRGLATEALAAFLELVTDRPLHARVAKDNTGSIRVLEKCGFVRAGEDKGFSEIRGEEVEEWQYKLE